MEKTPKPAAKRSTMPTRRKRKRYPPPPPRSADDPLSPQDELFVELFFHFGFDAPKAYSRAFLGKRPSTVRSQTYRLLNQPPIQAAIQRRRLAAREQRTLTRDEKVKILETIIRNDREETRDRLLAMRMHSLMVGDQYEGQHQVNLLTAAALKALSTDELIEQINRGFTTKMLPSPIIDVTPLSGNGHKKNGNGKR